MPSNNRCVLIIGGTRFQGPLLINAMIDDGYKVAIFHSGKHAIQNPAIAHDIIGDRNRPGDLHQLLNLDSAYLDCVIDTCAYHPDQVHNLLTAIGGKIGSYNLISTISVYKRSQEFCTELSPTKEIDFLNIKTVTPENYGALKAECEKLAHRELGDKVTVFRPSILIGESDHTQRLLFWWKLLASVKSTLQLEGGEELISLLDVRDYVRFVASTVMQGRTGIFNVCNEPVQLNQILHMIGAYLNCEEPVKTISRSALKAEGILPSEICYYPTGEVDICNDNKARILGHTNRNLNESISDICNTFKHQHDIELNMPNFAVYSRLAELAREVNPNPSHS